MNRQPVTGLSIPHNIGVGESEQQKLHNKWDTASQVEGELAMKGFMPVSVPDVSIPPITEELLTTADHRAYTAAYAQQNAWFSYSSQMLAQVTSNLLQAENEMEIIESKMRVAFRQRVRDGAIGKMTAQEMQDEINLDPRYQELRLMAQRFKQEKIQLQAYVDAIERGLRVISRQVEIRRMEAEREKVNIPGRQFPQGNHWGNQNDE